MATRVLRGVGPACIFIVSTCFSLGADAAPAPAPVKPSSGNKPGSQTKTPAPKSSSGNRHQTDAPKTPAPAPGKPSSGNKPDRRQTDASKTPAPRTFDSERRTVVVTSARTEQAVGDVAVSTQVVDRAEIEASGAEHAGDVLATQPGVQISRSFGGAGGAGISLHGLGPQHTLVLVDGQRVNGRIGGVIDLSRFPSEDIEQIEVVKGPASSLYGADAMAGVVNIITRRTKKPLSGELHARYGSFNTADLSAFGAVRRDKFRTQLSAGFHRTDGFTRPREGADERELLATAGNAANNLNLASRSSYTPNSRFRLDGDVSYTQRDLRGVDFRAPRALFDRRNLTRILGVNLAPQRLWSAPARLKLTGTYNYFEDQYSLDQRGSDELDVRQRTRDHLGVVGAAYDHNVGRSHLFSAGAELQFESLQTPRLCDDTDTACPARRRMRYGLYVQDEWTLVDRSAEQGPRLTLAPSVRLDVDSQFGGAASPRIALRFDPHPILTLRANYGLGFRAPSFKELYLLFTNEAVGYKVQGNPDLDPERSQGVYAGAELRLQSWGRLAASGFYNGIANLISFRSLDPDAVTISDFEYANLARVRTRGIEGEFGVRLLEAIGVDLTYTLTDARDLAQDRALPGVSAHQGTARLWLAQRKWGTQGHIRAGIWGPQRFYTLPGSAETGLETDEDQVVVPTYARLDVRVSQSFLKYFTVFAGVDNLLNAGVATYLPLWPRMFYGGLTIRY
ncbi:MAG: TonB-dependent receptor plug domain-containing protein [Nannocystaceae bacterium]